MSDPERLFSLRQRNALVIGGSSGIGRRIALGFAAAGARVAVAGTSDAKLDAVRGDLAGRAVEAGGHLALRADVTDPRQLRGLVDEARDGIGAIDILVNSQGVTRLQPALAFDREQYRQIVALNQDSVFFACLEAGRHMLERGRGSIINIASLASFRGFQHSVAYTMSKHAVLGLTRTLAAEWAEQGVRVNAIAPGFFMTPLNRDKMAPERKRAALGRTPMRRFGELDELVGAAVYLASPASGFVTGETLAVDGGFLAAAL